MRTLDSPCAGQPVQDCVQDFAEDSLPRPRIKALETVIPGCFELQPTVVEDARGSFTKLFHRPLWRELGLPAEFAEEYVTRSRPGTLRGLHFQLPPMDHAKVVVCLAGEVLDVALDLRRGSPTYGEHTSVALSAARCNALYLPPGLAHGFYVTGDQDALLLYKLTSVYSPGHDAGVRWDSAAIAWPDGSPVLSARDEALPPFASFDSPFLFG